MTLSAIVVLALWPAPAVSATSHAVGFTADKGTVTCGVSYGSRADPSRVYCTASGIPWPAGIAHHFGAPNVILGSTGRAELAAVSDDPYPSNDFVQLASGASWSGDRVTCHIAGRYVSCKNPSGHGFRIGGDSFRSF